MSDTTVLDKNPVTPTTVIGQAQPQNPVGSVGSKERVSLASASEINVAGPEVQHELTPELKDSGVQEIHDKPVFTQEHIDAGVKDSNPSPSVSTNAVILPMSEREIADKLKTGQDDDSGKGLARILNKIIKAMTFRIGS